MANLKAETIEAIDGRTIAFAEISDSCKCRQIFLSKKHNKEDVESFLNDLDFNYDSGFGSQNIYGYIAFTDGTWITRADYDGIEWWENHKYPNPDDTI